MNKIGITGVGGGVGQSVLKSLYDSGYELVALDGEQLAAGLYAAEKSYLIPYANKPNYISTLLEICKKEKISLLFPGLDAELMPLSLNTEKFKEIGTTIIVSSPDVITISDNKQETYNRLTSFGIKVPFTQVLSSNMPDAEIFPLIIKQKVGGARSKNVFLIKNKIEWEKVLEEIGEDLDSFVVQEYIDGDEYTCGSVNLNGECKGVIVMRRILRDGDTHKCFSEKNSLIEAAVKNITNTIKPFGACNVQLRMKSGVPYIFEINARCSGTTASRTLCGFNEPKMIADFLLKGIEPSYEIKEKTILRYWKELVVENEDVEKMKKNSTLEMNRNNFL